MTGPGGRVRAWLDGDVELVSLALGCCVLAALLLAATAIFGGAVLALVASGLGLAGLAFAAAGLYLDR